MVGEREREGKSRKTSMFLDYGLAEPPLGWQHKSKSGVGKKSCACGNMLSWRVCGTSWGEDLGDKWTFKGKEGMGG